MDNLTFQKTKSHNNGTAIHAGYPVAISITITANGRIIQLQLAASVLIVRDWGIPT